MKYAGCRRSVLQLNESTEVESIVANYRHTGLTVSSQRMP